MSEYRAQLYAPDQVRSRYVARREHVPGKPYVVFEVDKHGMTIREYATTGDDVPMAAIAKADVLKREGRTPNQVQF